MRLDPTTPVLGMPLRDFTSLVSKRVMLRVHLDECVMCQGAAREWQAAGDFTGPPAFCSEGATAHGVYTKALLALPPGAMAEFLAAAPDLLESP